MIQSRVCMRPLHLLAGSNAALGLFSLLGCHARVNTPTISALQPTLRQAAKFIGSQSEVLRVQSIRQNRSMLSFSLSERRWLNCTTIRHRVGLFSPGLPDVGFIQVPVPFVIAPGACSWFLGPLFSPTPTGGTSCRQKMKTRIREERMKPSWGRKL